jgi:formylglycine-generating enzyme required for sulfatase activity
MATASPSGPEGSLGPEPEARLGDFERAWRDWDLAGPPPRWQDFLPSDGECRPPGYLFRVLATDVECRAAAGLAGLLAEPYFDDQRLRSLGPEAVAELVRREYRMRWRRGERARRDEYLRRFPELGPHLSGLRPQVTCVRCNHAEVTLADEEAKNFDCPHCRSRVAVDEACASGASRFGLTTPPTRSPPDDPHHPSSAPGIAEQPGRSRRLGRFEVTGEIDRGGMGAVLRAHDAQLDREVAVKVLLDRHAARPDLRARFVEEAQIAGQLQHPGVVPVYELGGLTGGRPYFAMKLVKGRTLAELLATRQDLAQDLPHLLAMFEQVCQAVAYAHSRRVLHRDLKPSNVMVGAFGEVLVMDWGLAKVLDETPTEPNPAAPAPPVSMIRTRRGESGAREHDSRTEAGSVMGTPAYMPPEQACGVVEQLDERCDVFALGAVLCEILTGQPPYVAPENGRVLSLAAQGDQAASRARLDSCGADAGLVELAKACLSTVKTDRPRDAGAVAGRLAEYQRGVQERLRRAERERAAAQAREEQALATARAEQARAEAEQARAQAERRARVRAVALAAAVLVLVGALAVGGLVAWEARGRLTARALRDRLLVARTADVPAVVAELGPNRRWAEPVLRQALAEALAAGDARRRLHASLGLLPWDASQADYVFERLLDAEPGDVATLVAALEPHHDAVTGRLWGQAARPEKGHEGRRLRAACALASYDPEGGGWEQVSGPVVAQLVAENPVFLSHWLEGLRSVHDRLRPALEEVFRNRTEGRQAERALATNLLAEWEADRPDVLAGLLMDADPRQFALLWPRFRTHGPAGVAPLRQELHEPARFDWHDPPLPPSWAGTSDEVVYRIEASGGLVAECFAFCQGLPLEEFAEAARAMWPAGYRPIRVRPYGAPVHVAAVWTRDGRDWRLTTGRSADEVRRQDERNRRESYLPADVAGYLDGGRERCAAVWVRGESGEDFRVCTALSDKERQTQFRSLREAGLQPRAFQCFVAADGTPRYSAVWGPGKPLAVNAWQTDEATYLNLGLDHGLPVDVCLTPTDEPVRSARQELLVWLSGAPLVGLGVRAANPPLPHPERAYGGTFAALAQFDAVALPGLAPAEHLARCRELAAQGYRPVAVTEAEFPRQGGRLAASVWHRPVVPDDAKERLAKRQANAAVALLRLGQESDAWPLLRHRPDPRLCSYLIHRLSPLGADPRTLLARLDAPDVERSERRALLLCLGEFGPDRLPPEQRRVVLSRLLGLYRDDPDAGVHAAASWLLVTWARRDGLSGVDAELNGIDGLLRAADRDVDGRGSVPASGRHWYVNGQGQTMVLLEARGPFLMGSPRTEAERFDGPEGTEERQHRRNIGRTFALAATEVTVAQFRRFRGDHGYQQVYSPGASHPVNTVTWYDAAAYCNWLSKEAGIPEDQWCYEPEVKNGFGEGMRMKPDFLRKRGYRLPTEAEWEYACRAGAVTARAHGETEELLGQYAWYSANAHDKAMLPVGTLKPNDFGLFDLLGNAAEWCQDAALLYPPQGRAPAVEDDGDGQPISDRQYRVLRGGSFTTQAGNVRCAYRFTYGPADRYYNVGFRPARTCP